MKAFVILGEDERTCEFGGKHFVHKYRTIELFVVKTEKVFIKALHYTHDGMGDKETAYDQFGDEWTRKQYWDGWLSWVSKDKRVAVPNPRFPAEIDGEIKTSRATMRMSK